MKISKNFRYFLVATMQKFATKKNATQLTRLPKAQYSHMYSSLSKEWLQANQVEHIDCLTQIWNIASNFFQATHTFLPSLPEAQNTIFPNCKSKCGQ